MFKKTTLVNHQSLNLSLKFSFAFYISSQCEEARNIATNAKIMYIQDKREPRKDESI